MRDNLPGVVVPDPVIKELERAGPEAAETGVRLTVEILDAKHDPAAAGAGVP